MHLHPSSQQKSRDNVISGLRGCACSPANVFFYSASLEEEAEGKARQCFGADPFFLQVFVPLIEQVQIREEKVSGGHF